MTLLSIAVLAVGSWMVFNGVAHDLTVLFSDHGKTYDRNLLRLLMDGHILITCGLIQIISFKGIAAHQSWAFYTTCVASLSLLVYCALIFPFLKSYFTIFLNSGLIVWLIVNYLITRP